MMETLYGLLYYDNAPGEWWGQPRGETVRMERFIEIDELTKIVKKVRAARDTIRPKLDKGFRDFGVPESLHDGLRDYILEGCPTGSFLEACIENDLAEACGRADEDNRRVLFEITCWLHNCAPIGSWHYENAASRWVHVHQAERQAGR